MPPKIVFTKEQIIETAFQIFREEGIDGVTVRKLAARMNSSTAPIYTSFKNIDEIKKRMMEHALELLTSYTRKEYTPDLFLNAGIGMLEFARDYKLLYRRLFIENNTYKYLFEEFIERVLVQMKKVSALSIFSEEDMRTILNKMGIFTHGLASFLCAGMLEDESTEYFMKELGECGYCIIGGWAAHRGLNIEFEPKFREGCGE